MKRPRRSTPDRKAREFPESFVKGWMARTLPTTSPAEAEAAVDHLRSKGWTEEQLAESILPYMPRDTAPQAWPAAQAPSLPADVTDEWLHEHLPEMDRRRLRLVVDELERRGWPSGRVATVVLPHLLPKLAPEDRRAVVAGLADLGMAEEEIERIAGATPARRAGDPLSVHRIGTGSDLLGLDHVALRVADPEAMAAFMCAHVGMQRLPGTADFAVVGGGAGAATVWLGRGGGGAGDPGPLERLVFRVADVRRAVAMLPAGTPIEDDGLFDVMFDGPEGVGLGFTQVAGGGIDYDLDHAVLRCSDAGLARAALMEAGFVPRGEAVHVADKYLLVLDGSPGPLPRALLDHLAVRVDSIDRAAVVLPGPEQIRLRFVGRAPRG
jgi:catechol 2,3-dioxygenase-like lactoylglutathione lyase family enzyme